MQQREGLNIELKCIVNSSTFALKCRGCGIFVEFIDDKLLFLEYLQFHLRVTEIMFKSCCFIGSQRGLIVALLSDAIDAFDE